MQIDDRLHPDGELGTVQPDGDRPFGDGLVVVDEYRFEKFAVIGRQTAADRYVAVDGGDASEKLFGIELEGVAEEQQQLCVALEDLFRQKPSRVVCLILFNLAEREAGEFRPVERGDGDDGFVFAEGVVVNVAEGGDTHDHSLGKEDLDLPGDLFEHGTRPVGTVDLYQYRLRPVYFIRRQKMEG